MLARDFLERLAPSLVLALVSPTGLHAQDACDDATANLARLRYPAPPSVVPDSAAAGVVTFREVATLLPEGTLAYDQVGTSVGLDGTLAVLGAPGSTDGGIAHALRRDGASWNLEASIKTPYSAIYSWCWTGAAVAVEGNRFVVSDPYSGPFCSGPGRFAAFRHDETGWSLSLSVTGSSVAGASVAMGGGWMFAGDTGDSSCPQNVALPQVKAYARTPSAWSWHSNFRAGDTVIKDGFGASVAVSADGLTLVVGAPSVDVGTELAAGAAYVFEYDGAVWNEAQKLVARDPEAGAAFGDAVTIDGDTIVIGAPDDDGADTDTGSIYAFRKVAGAWVEEQNLGASNPVASARFGAAVSLDGNALAVGTPGTGRTHVFRDHGDAFRFLCLLVAAGDPVGERAGAAVDVDDGLCLVGAPSASLAGPSSGGARLFPIEPLALGADRASVQPGDTIVLTVFGGVPGAPVLLALSGGAPGNGWNGPAPWGTRSALTGTFDAEGLHRWSITLPTTLAARGVTFQAMGRYLPGKNGRSNAVTLEVAAPAAPRPVGTATARARGAPSR